ncbi:alpha-1,3-rhamnosyltransferase [Maricurvus nonylphenolicus]|uniref:glycosyltransferase family 2 protein n=1 Tax=Maricurvus nonylphenolicus TaxID=1008307 RepID=UPI0036F22B61
MDELPLVSVIIASYNHEKYIGDAISSVLNQTYSNVELIVIDDGSTDSSQNFLENLSKDKSFVYLAQKNSGLTSTLNRAFELSKGHYVAVLGSDDIMMLDRLEKQVAFMEERPDIYVTGGNILKIDGEGLLYPKQDSMQPYREFGFAELFKNSRNAPPAPTALVRRSAIEKVGGWRADIQLEDLYMWLSVTHLGGKIAVLNDVFAYYRIHPTNTTKKIRYMYENILKTYELFSGEPNYHAVRTKFLVSMFVKASKRDKALAREILKLLPIRSWNSRVIKGMFRLLSFNK